MSKRMNNNRKSNKGSKPSNGKGKRPYQSDTAKKPAVESSPSNDPGWYANNEAMMRDSASFPFNEAIGTPYRYDEFFMKMRTGVERNVSLAY